MITTAVPRAPGRLAAASRWAVGETHGLTKRFGANIAVDGVELLVSRGSAFGYLGRTAPARPRSSGCCWD